MKAILDKTLETLQERLRCVLGNLNTFSLCLLVINIVCSWYIYALLKSLLKSNLWLPVILKLLKSCEEFIYNMLCDMAHERILLVA